MQDHHPVGAVLLVVAHPLDRVLHHRQMRRVVGGERRRTHERHLAAQPTRHRRHLLVVGRHDQAIERAGRRAASIV